MEQRFPLHKLRRFVIYYAVGRFLLRKPFQKLVRYTAPLYDPGHETYLIVANHTNVLDPAFLFSSLKTHYRVVMSDHLFERPVGAWLLKHFSAPIISYQDASPDVVYQDMLDTLRSGVNVSLYAEARITDNGETGYISRRNATLVKEAECGLITYRFSDGYTNLPRWSKRGRWTPVYGTVVHHFTPAEVAAMSEEELYDIICRDLYYNAYDAQRVCRKKLNLRHPAEHAEYVLYGCPRCGSIGHLSTMGDTLTCADCGFQACIDAYGFWHAEGMQFDDLPSWDRYQKELIYRSIDTAPDSETILFSDEDQKFYFVDRNHKTHLVDRHGKIECYRDHFRVIFRDQDRILQPEDIRKVKYISKGTLVLVTKHFDLRIKTNVPRSAAKYVVAARYMKGKKSI